MCAEKNTEIDKKKKKKKKNQDDSGEDTDESMMCAEKNTEIDKKKKKKKKNQDDSGEDTDESMGREEMKQRETDNETTKDKRKTKAENSGGARPKTKKAQIEDSDSDDEDGDEKKNPEDTNIKRIYNTVLNHEPDLWAIAQKVIVIFRIDDEETATILSNEGQKPGTKFKHTEELLVDKLNERKEKVKNNNDPGGSKPAVESSVVTVYQNNSPCSNCTEKLIEFLEENKGVSLKIFVTSLYNIRRESCRKEDHYALIYENKHKANYNGLRNLINHDRCEINAYTKDDWKELLDLVTVSKEVKRELLGDYDKKRKGNDRSRKDEDERIKEDLEHIRTNVLE